MLEIVADMRAQLGEQKGNSLIECRDAALTIIHAPQISTGPDCHKS